MRAQTWLDTAYINVEVANGVVQLLAQMTSGALRVLVEAVSGAGNVKDEMTLGCRP
jgi:osmotically-inducible protein OsmY